MSYIQTCPITRQKTFEGTEAEFEHYRRKRPFLGKKRFIVMYEDKPVEGKDFVQPFIPALTLHGEIPDTLQEPSHILYPSRREFLLQKLEKSDADIKAGRTEKATTKMFKRLRGIAEENFYPSSK